MVKEGKGFEWWKEEKTRETQSKLLVVDRSTLDRSPREERILGRKKGENLVISKWGLPSS